MANPWRAIPASIPRGASSVWWDKGTRQIALASFFAQKVAIGSASIAASVEVNALGAKVTSEQHTGTASVAAAAPVVASGQKVAVGSASVAAGTSVSAAGKKVAHGATVIPAAVGVSAGGAKTGVGAANPQLQTAINAAGTKQASGSASISVVVSVEARSGGGVVPEPIQPPRGRGRTTHARVERRAKHQREDEMILQVIYKFLEVVQ